MQLKAFGLATSAILISVLGFLVVAEVILWFLPVSSGLHLLPVNANNPIPRYAPNRRFVFSDEWNFAIINRGRVNNAGFVNHEDYRKDDHRPLLAAIGDSYVEAKMVPSSETFHGLLRAQLADFARVYSFGVAGAPLSQYLTFADYTKHEYSTAFMIFNIVGNDFDESLKKYKRTAFHTYVFENGNLRLRRGEYEPSRMRLLLRQSALIRYLFFNMEVTRAYSALQRYVRREGSPAFAGNTLANVSEERLADTTAAIAAFFRDLPVYSGLPSDCILFVVDGVRDAIYNRDDEQIFEKNFVNEMRNEFMSSAGNWGYEVVDLHHVFAEHFEQHGQHFEFETDGHWNELGHELAAQAIQASDVFRRFVAEVRGDAPGSGGLTCRPERAVERD